MRSFALSLFWISSVVSCTWLTVLPPFHLALLSKEISSAFLLSSFSESACLELSKPPSPFISLPNQSLFIHAYIPLPLQKLLLFFFLYICLFHCLLTQIEFLSLSRYSRYPTPLSRHSWAHCQLYQSPETS